jgi:CheY-like chemotaxis protein
MKVHNWQALIVEDEFDSQQMVSKILSYNGISVRLVSNGQECIEALKEWLPTIIIMDLAMPKMDGWETLAAMRSDPRTAHIPVVAITAFHSDDVARGATQAGFDAYFRKPLNPLSFVNSLVEVMEV